MNIVTIDDHSFCPDLLPERAVILDAGCRGMTFANYFRELGHEVLAIDIDWLKHGGYIRCGLSDTLGKSNVQFFEDKNATRIISKTKLDNVDKYFLEKNEILIGTVDYFSEHIGKKFDLIKLDIEGEEYPVLKHAQHPVTKQISVEFHAHTGANTKQELDDLLDWLNQWYEIHNRVWEKRYGCSENYWDVLLIAK